MAVDPDRTSIDLGSLNRASEALLSRPKLPSRHNPIEKIAEGGMGVVHVAFDPILRRHVALKSLLPAYGDSNTSQKRFATEALITAQLDHPSIVPIYGMETDPDGHPAYAMKLVDGTTLKDLLRQSERVRTAGKPVPEHLRLTTLIEHFLKVCDAVSFAHDKSVLHRDLKPDNIMLGQHGEVYVMDWGLARTQVGAFDLHESLAKTNAGQILGTPRYMAPEQAEGDRAKMSAAADQYSLALILYRMIACRDARKSKGAFWLNLKVALDGDLSPLSPPHANELPWPTLYAVIERATKLEPEDRFPSVREFAQAVREARDHPPRLHSDTENVVEPHPLRRWIRRHIDATLYLGITMMALLAVGTAGIATVGVLGVEIYSSREKAREDATAALLSRVGERADRLDLAFQRVEAELEAIASTASALHEHGRSTAALYYETPAFDKRSTRPPDADINVLYSRVLSTRYPDISRAPGVSMEEVEPELLRLLPVAERMIDAHLQLRMRSEDLTREQAEEAWKTRPGPLRWVMVSTESGVSINVPGGFFETAGFDHRVRPWYQLGVGARSPQWGVPWQELSTGRLMIACSMQVTSNERPVGISSLAVGFEYLTNEAMVLDDPAVIETFLLDPQGRVMLRSSESNTRGRVGALSDTWATPPYAHLSVLDGKLGVEGVERVNGGSVLVVHQPMSLGWSYVVELDAQRAGF